MVLITICGRAGSKGLEGKNHRLFLGKPLVEYTLKAAQLFRQWVGSDNADIAINSDSPELLSYADEHTIFPVVRDQALAGDRISKTTVIKDTVIKMQARRAKTYDYVIDLDITSPLRKLSDIVEAYNKLSAHSTWDTVFSVTEARRNPFFNMVSKSSEDLVRLVCPSSFNSRQEAPDIYDMNASIYAFRATSIMRFERTFFEGNCGVVVMKDTYALDIDGIEDFNVMELLAATLFREEFREILE